MWRGRSLYAALPRQGGRVQGTTDRFRGLPPTLLGRPALPRLRGRPRAPRPTATSAAGCDSSSVSSERTPRYTLIVKREINVFNSTNHNCSRLLSSHYDKYEIQISRHVYDIHHVYTSSIKVAHLCGRREFAALQQLDRPSESHRKDEY